MKTRFTKSLVLLLAAIMAAVALPIYAGAESIGFEEAKASKVSSECDAKLILWPYYKVTATSGVNIRKGAGTNYSIVGAIPYGAVITVTQKSGNWGKTTYNGTTGWVCLDYCELTIPLPRYRVSASSGVNMRSGAGTSYSIVSAIPYGTVITVTQTSGNWGKTTYNGKTGWVCLDYCTKL